MNDESFQSLNLRRWPFNVSASETSAQIWVGRPSEERRLRRLIRAAGRVPNSQIAILWASFGSGKTHALRYMERLAEENERLVPLYVVIPRGIRSFLEIYQAIASSALENGRLVEAGRRLLARRGGGGSSDMERALMRLGAGDDGARVAAMWIRGEKTPMAQIRNIGLSGRIERVAHAVEALNELIDVLRDGGERSVILLLDEVQELSELGRRLPECVGGLHKVFDHNDRGLTLVLSFTTGAQSSVRGILGDALYNRCGERLTLPAFTITEARDFVLDLIEAWSIDPERAPFPFSRDAVQAVIQMLDKSSPSLTPRDLIRAFDPILRQALLDIEDGEISEIGSEYALTNLSTEEDDE